MKVRAGFGMGFLILFALPFAGFGLFAAFMAVRQFMEGKTREGFFLLVFALVFCGVGFGLIIGAIYGSKLAARNDALRAQNPDTPWLWRQEWATGKIKSSNRSAMIGMWIFALFWNAISSFVWWMIPRELAKGNHAALIALLFPLVGVGLLIWAIRTTLQWRKFGESVFEMVSVPGSIGGALAGTLHVQTAPRIGQEFRVALNCVQRITTGSGKSRSTNEHVRWQSEQTTVADAEGGVPVLFAIPSDCIESNNANPNDAIVWRLTATSQVPGVDFSASFEVPVFRVAVSAEVAALAEVAQSREKEAVAAYQPPSHSRIRVATNLQGETEFVFPPCRNPGYAFGTTMFFLLWSGAVAFMIWKRAPIVFPVIFGLIDLLIFYGVLNLWFASSKVSIGTETVRVSKRLLASGNVTSFPVPDVQDVVASVGTQVGQTVYTDIKIVPKSGRPVTVASSIRDKLHAEWLVAEMKKCLSLGVK